MQHLVHALPESDGLAVPHWPARTLAFCAAARTVRSASRGFLRTAGRKRPSMQDSAGKAVLPARRLDESEAAIPRTRAHRSLPQRFRRRERIERAAVYSAARATRESIDSAISHRGSESGF